MGSRHNSVTDSIATWHWRVLVGVVIVCLVIPISTVGAASAPDSIDTLDGHDVATRSARLFQAQGLGPTSGGGTNLHREWYVNDDPFLWGPEKFWHDGAQGAGYGSNNFKYTDANGNSATAVNWVHWYMGDRSGRQEVEVYVPTQQATSTVLYEVSLNNSAYASATIRQKEAFGWTQLGAYDFNGGDVVITTNDNTTLEDADDLNDYGRRLIGIDAIRMRCVERCPGQQLAVPTGVVYSGQALRWNRVPGVSSYEIEWRYSSETAVTRGTKNCRTADCWFQFFPDISRRFQARVRAQSGDMTSAWSDWWIVGAQNVAPGAVTGVTYASGTITWIDLPEANAYDVELHDSGGGIRTIHNAACCALRLQFTGVDRNLQHFRLRATNGLDGPWTAWTAITRPTQELNPTPPRNVIVDTVNEIQLRITWEPPSNSGSAAISNYRVVVSRPAIGSLAAWSSGTVNVAGTSFATGNLRYGTTYTVTIATVNHDNRTSPTVSARATTDGRQTTPPGVVRDLRAVAHGTQELRATWSAPSNSGSSGIRNYQVVVSRPAIGTDAAWTSGTVTVNGTSFTSGTLRYGTTYTVTVKAVNGDRLSSQSASVRATTSTQQFERPGNVRDINVDPHGERKLRVTWSTPSSSGSSGIRNYRVVVSRPAIGSLAEWTTGKLPVVGTSYTTGTLRYGTTYTVTVTAVNQHSKVGTSASAQARTRNQVTALGSAAS